jgi:hypothetical protein
LINHIYILIGVPRARGVGGTAGASSRLGHHHTRESGYNIPDQGLTGLIGYSYQQVATSFMKAHLERTPKLSVLGLERWVTDREVRPGCARVRTKCAEKTLLVCEGSLCSRKAARCKRAWPRGGGTLQNGIRADSRGFTGACIAVAQAWCAWLVWTQSGHIAWHMHWHWTHGRGQERTFLTWD